MKTKNIEDIYPLSPMQQGMLFHTLHSPEAGEYVVQIVFTLAGDLRLEELERSWRQVIERHPALRTAFFWRELKQPMQVVHRRVDFAFERLDWRDQPASEQQSALQRLLESDRQRGYDLEKSPLMRCFLIRIAEDRHQLVWSHHHLLLDGWSLPLVMKEVFSAYEQGAEWATRARRPRPYREFIHWLKRQEAGDAEAFWRRTLSGFEHPTPLGVDRQPATEAEREDAPEAETSLAVVYDETRLYLSAGLTRGLDELARRHQITPNTFLQGAWALLLSRYSQHRDVVFGAAVSGRPPALPGVESMVGLFINTVPVRVAVDPGRPLLDWLRDLQEKQSEAQAYSYSPLLEVQGWSEVEQGRPLFESLLVYENFPLGAAAEGGDTGLEIADVRFLDRSSFPLTIKGTPGERLRLRSMYDRRRFEPATVERLVGHLEGLLRDMVESEGMERLGALSFLTAEEEKQLLCEWGGIERPTPDGGCLHHLFEDRVRRSPEAEAVVEANRRLSYDELNRAANRLAHHLRELGVGPEVPVALLLERSCDQLIAILAVLKAGGYYVPLDPAHPIERSLYVIEHAGVERILTQDSLRQTLPQSVVEAPQRHIVSLDRLKLTTGDTNPTASTSSQNLAYVIYTSGSTGRPKGVAIAHRQVARLLATTAPFYRFDERDVWPIFHSYAFDVSVWEIWGALLHGGKTVVVPRQVAQSPRLFWQLLAEEKVTVLNQTPSAFLQLSRAEEELIAEGRAPDTSALRWIVFAGEALDFPTLVPWFERHGFAAGDAAEPRPPRLVNMYGITETTVHVTVREIVESDLVGGPHTVRSAVGTAMPDLGTFLLDPSGQPVPVGVAGEIHVAGPGLARGYFGRPGLTASRFVPDAWSGGPGARLYRSGDLARWLERGELEFLGRRDHQVQIRGFRVEPGEIEGVLTEHPAVRQAVVLVHEPEAGDLRLVAYVVPGSPDGGESPSVDELRRHCESALPDYMVPAGFLLLDELPLTANSKVDRRALPDPSTAWETVESTFVAPRNQLEEVVANLWCEVLGVERVSVEDSFFHLGGHSLLAVRLISRLRQVFNVDLPFRSLFRSPTVAGIAQVIEDEQRKAAGSSLPPIVPVSREHDLPLSFSQQRLWFLDQLQQGSTVYNLMLPLRFEGEVEIPALAAALDEIRRRHEVLRTTFLRLGDRPVQIIEPFRRRPLPVVDLSALPRRQAVEVAERLSREAAARPIDLERGPLFSSLLLRAGERWHQLLNLTHHIVFDGSIPRFIVELVRLYRAFAAGEPRPLAELPVQYADFAHWQQDWLQGETFERQLEFWRERLGEDPPKLELPLDRPRPALQTTHGARRFFALDDALSDRFAGFARASGATPFMVGLAAFTALLYRLSGQRDLCIGTPIEDRPLAELDGLIGCFVNTLVLRLRLDGDLPFKELVDRVRDITLDAHTHKDIPFEALVEALQPKRSLSHNPLFQVMFVLNNALPLDDAESFGGLSLSQPQVETGTSRFDLMAALWSSDSSYLGSLEYNTDLFDATTIARLERQLVRTLEEALDTPEKTLDRIELLDAAQRQQLSLEWNDTATRLPRRPIEARIEARAAEAADAIAVLADGRACSYRELLHRARSLSALLQRRGVERGTLVGIHQRRSVETVISVLATLTAGAAYVPIETRLPDERVAYLVDSLKLQHLLSDVRQLERLGRLELDSLRHLILVDGDGATAFDGRLDPETWRHEAGARPLPSRAAGEDLAYIIFTSGSTGRPKGVAVARRAVENLIDWVHRDFAFGAADRVLFVTALSFDLSVFDLLGILCAGGSIRVASEDELADPQTLAALLDRERITFWDSAPAALQQVAPFLEPGSTGETLRQVFLSGDWIPLQLPKQIRAAYPSTAITSLGGATEATVWSNFHRVDRVEPHWASIPYGRPMINARYHVLDPRLAPCPIGVEGDLYIAGTCLATGYAGAAGLTASKYLPDPLAPRPGGRLYATGDRARVWHDGTLEFLGRRDAQVKVRGFRVELGEIEAVLGEHPAVREAAVTAHRDTPRDNVPTGGHLVAWIVPAGGSLAPETLREDLRRQLPEYMVPGIFHALDSLPLSPTGKLDRSALMRRAETLESTAEITEERFQGPRDPFEEILAEIWQHTLGRSRIDIHHSFFELGGESLKAAQVVSRLRRSLDLEVPMRLFFERPTIAELAAGIAELTADEGLVPAPPLLPRDEAFPRDGAGEERPLPLSFAQERLWFLDQLDPGSPIYNVPTIAELGGRLDAGLLERSLEHIIARHEAIRTTFSSRAGSPMQHIAEHLETPFEVIDLTALPAAEREAEALRYASQEVRRGFDLERGPLLRFTLLRLAEERHLAVLNMHHIVSDAWSLWVFLRELATIYSALARGEEPALAPLQVQYPDFALWQRHWLSGEVLERQLAYWRERLAGAPPLFELPADQRRPAAMSYRGRRLGLVIDEELTARVKAFARERGVTLFITLLAAFKTLLLRLTGRLDPLVGTTVANRNRAEIEPLIGFFINTLVLYSDLGRSARFVDVLARVRETVLGAFAHQDVPFEKLVTELGIERQTSHAPIAQVMFGLETAMNTPGSALDAAGEQASLGFSGLEMTPRGVEIETAKFDLTLTVRDDGERLATLFVAARDLFDATTVRRWRLQFRNLLEVLIDEPERGITDLDLLLAAERQQMLIEWNDAPAYPRCERIHDGIVGHGRHRPAAIAVVAGEEQLSYGALISRATRLARALQERGAGPEKPVGAQLQRSPELAVAMLGIFVSGGVYLPLDPAYPVERRALMLAESGADLVLCHGPAAASERQAGIVYLDLAELDLGAAAAPPPRSDVAPSNLAYLLFTSGSTGRPKGVMGHHLGLANRLAYALASGQVHTGDRVLQRASISFDLSLIEMLSTLTAGATLAFADSTEALDPLPLTRLIARQRLSVAFLTPSILQVMTELPEARQCRSLRAASSGAEAISVDLQNRFFELFDAEFFNRYGPTETAVSVTSWTCRPGAARRSVPIGRPMAQTRLYLLDRQARPVPLGAPGELTLGGVCVARGYLHRGAMTAEVFVPDPWSAEPGARLYRTGDLVRYLPNGDVEFLGRRDHQVKIRGFRIELGEIEGVLEDLSRVREAVALVRPAGAGGARLVAYVVPSAEGGAESDLPTVPELRAAAARKLPDYMVPTAIVILPELPRSPNGKLDRAALPEPDLFQGDGRGSGDPVEDVIASLWIDVLGPAAPAAESLHAESHFFELGGHSLLATQVLARLRETFAIDLPLADLFEAATLGELAERVKAARRGFDLPPLVRRDRDDELPLSFAQTRLWLADRLQPGDPSYNVPSAVRLRGPLQLDALRRSFDEVMRRHEVLRTRFVERHGEPRLVIDAKSDLSLPQIDLRALAASDRERVMNHEVRAEARRPFDLARGPMMRLALLRLDDRDAVLLATLHHIAADGWSTGLLIAEVTRLYDAFAGGGASPLPEPEVQYADFAAWQHSWLRDEVLDHHLSFWRQQLSEAPRLLALPTDRPRPARRSFNGANQTFVLDAELRQSLIALGRSEEATPFMTLLAIYQLLLARLSGQDDLVVGASIANRGLRELESMVGFFVNNLSLRADLSEDPTFRDFLAQVRERSLGAFEHQDLPFEVLVDRLQIDRDPSITPVFQALFVYQNLPQSRELKAAGLSLHPLELRSVTAKYDLSLFVSEIDGSLQGTFEYSTDLFDPETVQRWARALEILARQVVDRPDEPVSRLAMAEETEYAAAVDAFNVDLLDPMAPTHG